jgi:hypothetical protein
MEFGIVAHCRERARARATVCPIVSDTPAVGIRGNGSIANRDRRRGGSNLGVHRQPRDDCERLFRSVGEGLASKITAQKDFAVREFGLREAQQRKANAR